MSAAEVGGTLTIVNSSQSLYTHTIVTLHTLLLHSGTKLLYFDGTMNDKEPPKIEHTLTQAPSDEEASHDASVVDVRRKRRVFIVLTMLTILILVGVILTVVLVVVKGNNSENERSVGGGNANIFDGHDQAGKSVPSFARHTVSPRGVDIHNSHLPTLFSPSPTPTIAPTPSRSL